MTKTINEDIRNFGRLFKKYGDVSRFTKLSMNSPYHQDIEEEVQDMLIGLLELAHPVADALYDPEPVYDFETLHKAKLEGYVTHVHRRINAMTARHLASNLRRALDQCKSTTDPMDLIIAEDKVRRLVGKYAFTIRQYLASPRTPDIS